MSPVAAAAARLPAALPIIARRVMGESVIALLPRKFALVSVLRSGYCGRPLNRYTATFIA
jgi:hypothetical protein